MTERDKGSSRWIFETAGTGCYGSTTRPNNDRALEQRLAISRRLDAQTQETQEAVLQQE